MTTTAGNVAAALREELPGVDEQTLHCLLFYAQARRLALQGEPLFGEAIAAWDSGPVVPAAWGADTSAGTPLTESQMGTLLYVVGRYGRITPADLHRLARSETPWKTADALRGPGGSATIQHAWMRDFYRRECGPPVIGGTPIDAGGLSQWIHEARAAREAGSTQATPQARAERRGA